MIQSITLSGVPTATAQPLTVNITKKLRQAYCSKRHKQQHAEHCAYQRSCNSDLHSEKRMCSKDYSVDRTVYSNLHRCGKYSPYQCGSYSFSSAGILLQ